MVAADTSISAARILIVLSNLIRVGTSASRVQTGCFRSPVMSSRRAFRMGIASGGCGNVGHIVEVLTDGRADAALAASIFHYGRLTPAQVKESLREKGLPAR